MKENPGQFGYNGIKGGMSGVSFVMGWMYAFTDDAQQLMNGPFDESVTDDWDKVLGDLRSSTRTSCSRPAMPARSTC